ncbi:nitric oxide synthase oxygenase [Coleofasciculus sp. E2-BRE-01]|uniref:nitric oxide synthase oxygenase n=1 Tax=Coleofasciculus sp. E2-BRE-01 TaxID=3069524 RepID=UPI0032FDC40B
MIPIVSPHNLIIFVSNPNYLPAQQLIQFLNASSMIQVRGLKRDHTVSSSTKIDWFTIDLPMRQSVIKDRISDSEIAVMFIMPADLPDVKQLTHSFLELTQEIGVQRLAWVAPACPEASELGKTLAEAENLVRHSNLETLILRHAPLFSELLDQKKELKYRRTLSLPLGNNALPWLAPDVISQGLYQWVVGEVNNSPPDILTGPVQLTGEDMARELSQILKQNANSHTFAQSRFQAIDLDASGQIDAEELLPYLLQLGYSHDEAQTILEEADTDKNGSIDFEEFSHGLQEHLDKILADVPTDVYYFNSPSAAVFYDWTIAGMDEKTAQARLDLLAVLNQYGLPNQHQELVRWLGQGSISLSQWATPYALDLINVHILPGRGILTLHEGQLAGRPALTTRLLQSNDRLLIGQRTLDNEALEWRWADEEIKETEQVRYIPEKGGERVFRLKNGKVVSLSVRGRWTGVRLATQLFFQEEPIPRWQISLFRELGELQIENATNLGADDDLICNCTKITCGHLKSLIDGGLDTLEKIAEQTQATTICGGCQPLLEELLGSASLAVAELVTKEQLGSGMTRFEFRPVQEAVVAAKPGQHILIQGRVDNRWVTRAYTLSSAAESTETYEITVKREELGVFSRWLCDRANSDSLFRISQPRGDYFLGDENPVVFFAGGIGVTPAIAMMRTLAQRQDKRRFHLDYSVPYPENFVYANELNQLTQTHPNLTVTRRATRTEGRLTAESVQHLYPYTEGAVAFLCGPGAFMDTVRGYLEDAGFPAEAIRQELFSSKLDEEGNAHSQVVQRPTVQLAGGITPIEKHSFYVEPIGSVSQEAEAFLKQCYIEQGLPEVFLPRWQAVKESIDCTGTYTHTYDELVYGSRLAWRNSNRCVGRLFWHTLQTRDMRHLDTEAEIFKALVDHIKLATNNGDLQSIITIFQPDLGIRIWNPLLLRYAGYRQPDGSILGDPANVELTDQALNLGWQKHQRTPFDILPLIIQIGDKAPHWFELPPEIILEVPLSHPRYEWFEELGLKWFALPAVSSMVFDVGGIQYPAPFNGFYLGAEIGARNFSDTNRYNMLPIIAQKMGLDCRENMSLWKDSALVELNIAVLHSYKKQGVRILDHHTLTDSFMQFVEDEKRCGRPVHGDWAWLVPPLSGSTTPTYGLELENRLFKPSYFYQPDPWQTKTASQGCPFHEGL